MIAKKTGRGLIIAGAAGIGLSFLLALLFHGNTDLKSIQILGIEISAIVVLLGAWLTRTETTGETQPRQRLRELVERLLDLPTLAWVLLGFLIVYLLLFIPPLFLNPNLQMNYFGGYIPNLNPIGNDLRVMLEVIKGWVTGNQSPYTIQFYPPLTYIVFAPLLLIKDYFTLYRVFTWFTLFNYCLLTLLLPLKIIDKKHLPLAILLFVTGLFSYGFQFELERGQYNIFTFLLCLTSIYIFHYHRKYRLLAYFLFSLSVQLKLYPAIFIVMFVDDWRAWKNVILRFAGIGLLNLLFFLAMGYRIFLDFVGSVTAQIASPSWIGPWNHSISSFISMVKRDGLGLIDLETLRVLRHNSEWVEVLLILAFLILFLSALVIFHLRKEAGLDPYLLLACTIGALILPISYDYTLSILAVPILLLLCGIPEMNSPWRKRVSILLTLGISIAYFVLLIPYHYRPHVLDDVFPLLFLILLLATILNFMRYKSSQRRPAAEQDAAPAGSQ